MITLTKKDIPEPPSLNWEPYLWLFFIFDLFVPFAENQTPAELRHWLIPTLLSLPLFLVIYLRQYRKRWHLTLRDLLPIALIGYALLPLNPYAVTYLGYAALFSSYALVGLVRPLLLSFGLIVLFAIEIALLHLPQIGLSLYWAVLLITLSCVSGFFRVKRNRRSVELQRLAALEERERIGRDLHDLLGQTLSLIALKSELASMLVLSDPTAAAREITDVMNTARESLKQVRAAVAGMRSVALADEVNSARTLLESSGVTLTFGRDGDALPPDVETVLGMVVREAATNIHRHAAATRAWIQIKANESVLLLIGDNGCGGAMVSGNGLKGIHERIRSLGGSFEVDSIRGRGTVLRANLPLTSANSLSSSTGADTVAVGVAPP